jgi:hypothetical protein
MQQTIAQMRAAQVQQGVEAVRLITPALRPVGEYAEQARQLLEMIRSSWPLVEYAQRHTAQMQQAITSAGFLLAYADKVALARDAGLLRPAGRDVAGPRHHTVGASLTITPTFTVHAEVVKAADNNDVEVKPDARPDTRPIDLAALGVQLFIAWAIVFPMVQNLLPAEDQQVLGNYIAWISLMLAIVWRYEDKHKR